MHSRIYAAALTAQPTVLSTVPGRTVTATLTAVNPGDAATAQFLVTGVPAGWAASPPANVLLPSGAFSQVPLAITPGTTETAVLSVTLRLLGSPGTDVTRAVVVRSVPELAAVTRVVLSPDFLPDASGSVAVDAYLANRSGLPLPSQASVRLSDAAGQVHRTLAVSLTVPVQGGGPFTLGALSVDGLGAGVYTATVELLDEQGALIPGAANTAPLAIGQGLHFSYQHAPVRLAPGAAGVTVTTAITTERVDVLTGTVPFTPTLKWARTTFAVAGSSNQVVCMPAVGDVDLDGVPDVVFSTYDPASDPYHPYEINGILRVVSGDDGHDVFNVVTATLRVRPLSNPLIVDLDNDGAPEIVIEREAGGLYAFDNAGRLKYSSAPTFTLKSTGGSMPAAADLDGDGRPEVVVGRYALSHDLRQVTALGPGGDILIGGAVADVNLDGRPEVIAGNAIYSGTGGVQAQNPALTDMSAVALGNFDADLYPEIVFVDPQFTANGGRIYLLDHRMNVVWGPIAIPRTTGAPVQMANGGPPTVADFDGDGWPEIGVAGDSAYAVFDTDGTLLWRSYTQDLSSGATGSSVFDFQGDGRAEVVYADELALRIYDGASGAIIFQAGHTSVTGTELPVTADVDADGHAEIVVVDNDTLCGPGGTYCEVPYHGVRVFEAQDDSWVSTRQLWHQHAYDVTGVDENLRVVSNPTPSWLLYNTFRSQAPTPAQGNTYFVDVRHNLPATGSRLLTTTISPPPLSYSAAQIHWLYHQQDRVRLRVGQVSQQIDPPLEPGEARRISTGTPIAYTIGGVSSALVLPALYVEAPHVVDLSPAAAVLDPGDTVRYTITLTNAFSSGRTFGLSILGLPPVWANPPSDVVLAAGATAHVPLTVSVPPGAAPQVYTLLVRAVPDSGGEDAASAQLTVRAAADLQVTQSDAPDPVAAGASLTYTLVVRNSGPWLAGDVTLTDTLPAGAVLSRATFPGGACSQASGKATCALGSLGPGAQVSVTLLLTPTLQGIITNTVQIGSTAVDPNPDDNRTAETTTVLGARLAGVGVSGFTAGLTGVSYPFVATVAPLGAAQPITYVWEASGQAPLSRTGGLSDTVSFTWGMTGTQTITVTAHNVWGSVTGVHTIFLSAVAQPPLAVQIAGPANGVIGSSYEFFAVVDPLTATQPLTYTWQTEGQPAVVHSGRGADDSVTFTWSSEGTKSITVTVANGAGSASSADSVTISAPEGQTLYLPLVLRTDSASGPDLVIHGIRVTPALPTAGQPASVEVGISNRGTLATDNWFFVDLYVDPASAPVGRSDLSGVFGYVPAGLAPGASCTVTFSVIFAGAGTHTLYAQADTYDGFNGSAAYGLIDESNEGNNIYGPFHLDVGGSAAAWRSTVTLAPLLGPAASARSRPVGVPALRSPAPGD